MIDSNAETKNPHPLPSKYDHRGINPHTIDDPLKWAVARKLTAQSLRDHADRASTNPAKAADATAYRHQARQFEAEASVLQQRHEADIARQAQSQKDRMNWIWGGVPAQPHDQSTHDTPTAHPNVSPITRLARFIKNII